jgi:transcriptional regulator
MYLPKHFDVDDPETVFSFIKNNAFGQLISTVEGRLFSTHIPFLVADNRLTISGHVAKKNPQWEHIQGQEVLITLQGPHDYISPSMYNAPGVPTWDYQAVHIYGSCEVIREPEYLKDLVENLTGRYENGREAPWTPSYNDSMLKAIVGLEITISDIQCKFKVSQNRSAQDREQVATDLERGGSYQLAAAVRRQ